MEYAAQLGSVYSAEVRPHHRTKYSAVLCRMLQCCCNTTLGYPQFGCDTISLVGIPLVWWGYQQYCRGYHWFGGGTLSLVNAPLVW